MKHKEKVVQYLHPSVHGAGNPGAPGGPVAPGGPGGPWPGNPCPMTQTIEARSRTATKIFILNVLSNKISELFR